MICLSKQYCLLLMVSLFFFQSESFAQESKIKQIKGKIKQEQRKLAEVKTRESSILKQLKRFDLRLEELQTEVKQEKSKLRKINQKINHISNDIVKTEQKKAALDQEISKQLKNTYKYGKPQEALDVFNFDEVQWARRNERVYKLWYKHNYDVLLQSEALLAQLQSQQNKLQLEKDKQQASIRELAATEKKLKQQRSEKDALLKRVLGQKEFYEKNIAELKIAEKKMNRLMRSLQSKNTADSQFAKLKGDLPWPTDGKVFEKYGAYFDQKLKVKLYRKGIRIRAKKDAEVTAIHDGRVVYAGWFDGYGRVVILDHGDGYFSLYAHLGKVFKDKNQMTIVGDVIGYVGDTGTVYGDHLYFELRQKGLTIDPLDWLE
ncbi:MAG TPA: peptidoglycan DD-metalloendopeptidase family protein [Oligoflexia bacterium]|nr:peptidoglycan DD-metalloendopeptidase family protein [Oligoflexia bacterium]HMR24591.1 peptidoglycan DD-metalloendopeptidase family protein [Oligoflexia bacterium]